MSVSVHPATKPAPRIVIIGGGVAGMAAAVALESAGLRVTLLEALRRLGGRAGSFEDAASGDEIDNSQHVLLGCCTNLIDFYRRIGALHKIRFHRVINFLDDAGHLHRLWGMQSLPAPLHLAPAMAAFRALSLSEKLAASRAILAMMRLGRSGRRALDGMAFGQWLDEQRQPQSLIDRFYDPLLIGSLNEETRKVSAKYALQVFGDAILANPRGYVLGLPDCPLSRLYEGFRCRDVRLGARVTELIFDGARICAVRLASGESIDADYVIIATNHHVLRKLVPPQIAAADCRFDHLDRLESVPILGAHLWFDRPVFAHSHAALLGGPLQWIFRKDRAGHSICGVISAAREWVDVPHERCIERFAQQVRTTLREARDAQLMRARIIIEKRATFAPLPGVDGLRPRQAADGDRALGLRAAASTPAGALAARGGIGNLLLAGDYTRTDWPATMEGAVRSGYLAAEALVAQLRGTARWAGSVPLAAPRRFLQPDLSSGGNLC